MEVTRKNFKESLPAILSSIDRADFLVVDAEFTGLTKGREVSMFDSPMEYYRTILKGCSDFLLSQFGLCAFCWDDDKKQYINEAYNFYVFPRGAPGAEKIFLCQSSSLDFLAAQGFDFNKWIREGISYVTEPVEEYLRKKILDRQNSDNAEREFIPVPDENKQQIEDICKRVQQFIEDNDSEQMEIDRCNPFIRRLLFQELGKRFQDDVFLDTKILENKDRVLVVTRVSSTDDTKKRRMMKEKKEWDDFEDIIGFSKVARMISYSGKLVVGHNMLLDVMHTLNHFFQALPSDYEQFKEFAHCMFPKILDTKYMSSLSPFKDKVNSNVLQHLYASLTEEPFSMPTVGSEKGRGYTGTDDKNHEAGYDAYVTGVCFIAMYAHLCKSDRVNPSSPVLKPYLNKLFLARTARQDSPYMNLDGDDPTPSRDHVFHMTFPKEWQRNDINALFSPYGQIIVQFLDDTTAYVALTNRKRAKEMSKALSGHDRVKLVPFVRYQKIQCKSEELRREWLTSKKIAMRTGDSTVRQELPEEGKRKKNASSSMPSSPAPPSATVRTAKKTVQSEIDETEPSPPKKSRLRTSSNSKQNTIQINKEKKSKDDKVQETSFPDETDETEPSPPKKSRLRTSSNSKQNTIQINKEKRTKAVKEDEESDDETKWPVRNDTKPEDVFTNQSATQCVSVFKESDSWV